MKLPKSGTLWRVKGNDPDQPLFYVVAVLFIDGVPWVRYRQENKPDDEPTRRPVSDFLDVFEAVP